jgi:hypothetical protein
MSIIVIPGLEVSNSTATPGNVTLQPRQSNIEIIIIPISEMHGRKSSRKIVRQRRDEAAAVEAIAAARPFEQNQDGEFCKNSKQASRTSDSQTSTIDLWMEIFLVGVTSDIRRITVRFLGQVGLAQPNWLTDKAVSSVSASA